MTNDEWKKQAIYLLEEAAGALDAEGHNGASAYLKDYPCCDCKLYLDIIEFLKQE